MGIIAAVGVVLLVIFGVILAGLLAFAAAVNMTARYRRWESARKS